MESEAKKMSKNLAKNQHFDIQGVEPIIWIKCKKIWPTDEKHAVENSQEVANILQNAGELSKDDCLVSNDVDSYSETKYTLKRPSGKIRRMAHKVC